MNVTLQQFQNAAGAIGRGVAFYADPAWDGTTDLALTHLGEVEGPIVLHPNGAMSYFTAEVSGPAKRKGYVDGADPTVDVPLYIGDPAKRAIISPTGSGSIGHSRRRPVNEITLVIFPEELFYDEEDDVYGQLVLTFAAATVNGKALTAKQEFLLGQSMWFWRGHFNWPDVTYSRGDADKAIAPAVFQVMMSEIDNPEGELLMTLGNPADADIAINPVTS